MPEKINIREKLRNDAASEVCREVRYQLAKYGGIADNEFLFDLLNDWMKKTGKNKYNLPKKRKVNKI